jgi:two-component system, OmpR family, sensor histidine kinase ChvG
MRISLRAKMVLVALVLALIPLVGYLHVKQMERLLREGQEQALLATARAIATALHDRPQLLELRAGQPASGEMELILKSLARADSRIWIVDQQQRLLALAGDLKKSAPVEESSGPLDLAIRLVRPVTSFVLERPSDDFDDALPEEEIANGPVAASALQGVAARRWRLTPDSRAVILSASYPVWDGERVVAAVVAEETTNRIRSVYNRAMEQVVAVTLISFLAGGLVLLAFASRISTRLQRLRDEAEAAIDSQGRVRKLLAGSAAGDEIGDLSRSFSTVLERLAQYNRYLENMAGRLSHELRTPIAVVRSSLENLKLEQLPSDASVYLERANDGLKRLDTLLTRMSEATRLEQAVRETQRERFDAAKVVQGCITGYRVAYPATRFELDAPEAAVDLRGAPDLYAQMLDKLVANAVDFATGDEPIRVRLEAREGYATLTVSNRGPRLPEAMSGKLFESMVSVRPGNPGKEPHLGLGLYIARLVAEFHGGIAQALDREDGSGVVIKIRTPLDSGSGS